MWSWLSQVSPDTVVGLVVALGAYAYHRLVPPAAQTAIDHQMDGLKSIVMQAASTLAPGTPISSAVTQLRGVADSELAKLHLSESNPLVKAAVDAAVNAAVAWLSTQPKPRPGEVPVVPLAGAKS